MNKKREGRNITLRRLRSVAVEWSSPNEYSPAAARNQNNPDSCISQYPLCHNGAVGFLRLAWHVKDLTWQAGEMSHNRIESKKAIVTGATRGIGRAIAKMLLEEGAQVAICGRTLE